MSPFEQDVILPTLRRLNDTFGAIHADVLASWLCKPDRTMRHYLKRLEQLGAVKRPYGPRKGWLAGDLQLQSV
jgi:hypothetical protein